MSEGNCDKATQDDCPGSYAMAAMEPLAFVNVNGHQPATSPRIARLKTQPAAPPKDGGFLLSAFGETSFDMARFTSIDLVFVGKPRVAKGGW